MISMVIRGSLRPRQRGKLHLHRRLEPARRIRIGIDGSLCFVETTDGIRVISFRKANDREVKRYAEVQTPD